MPVVTRREKTVNNRNQGVTSITMEEVGAADENAISAPSGTKIRNVRRSIADGRAVLTYDEVDPTVGDTYSVSGTASQEPLATHPYFQNSAKWAITEGEWKKWDKWQKEGTDLSNLTIKNEGGVGFQSFIYLYLRGFTDYLQPRLSIRVTDANTTEPKFDDLGKIATPPKAPELKNDANWLMTGCDATQDVDGNWEVTREYMSSGPGGWNKYIYGTDTPP